MAAASTTATGTALPPPPATTALPAAAHTHEEVAPSKELPWPPLESLKPPTPTGDSDQDIVNDYNWHLAVAPAVTALGRIVARHFDVTATRVLPTYDAVVGKLQSLGLSDKVPKFDAEWKELCDTSGGRAVIAVCGAAAEGGMLLGRIQTMETAEEYDLECNLSEFFKGRVYLPTLLEALHYCRTHPAATIDVPTSEWPLLTYHALEPYDRPRDFPSAEWYAAVAPAVMAVRRIVVPTFLPEAAAGPVDPSPASVVTTMQELGRDADVSKFKDAWDELRRSSGGRAVLAVCRAAEETYAKLGDVYMARRADDPGLENELTRVYAHKDCLLPVLLAALHYYRGGAGGSGASEGAAAAAGGAGGSTM